jgi:antitoxin component of MazEF toxin-antitoxin module
MVIPRNLRDEAGVSEGTLLRIAVVEGGRFLVTPQVSIDRSIVTNSDKSKKQLFRDLAQVVSELRQEAKEKGLDTMSKKEIGRAVAATRRDLKKNSKRPAK